MTVERIYIGGLNPPRLTGADIVSRLKSLDIEVLSVIAKENKPFVHLTATSKGSDSALEIISRKYNNVKWKGCKLAVAAARPHFLDLLEMERQHRTQQIIALQRTETGTIQTSNNTTSDEEHDDTSSALPRRLRIRKKFGEEAVHVDTKPWQVDNWAKFSKATSKLRKRVQNHVSKKSQMKSESYKPTPLMHRAVHIKFNQQEEEDRPNYQSYSRRIKLDENSFDNSHDEESVASDSDSSSSNPSSSAASVQSESDKERRNVQIEKKAYIWSDDFDDDDDDSQNSDESSSVSSEEASQGDDGALHETKEYEMNIQDDNTSKKPIGPSKSNTKVEYQWSSDSDSDESAKEYVNNDRPSEMAFKEVTTTDEFAAGLDIESDGESIEDEDTKEYQASVSNTTSLDMENDVSANLNILSNLFPEMTGTSPALIAEDSKTSNAGLDQNGTKSLFGTVGLMPRYDPRDESTQKYEVGIKDDESVKSASQTLEDENKSKLETEGDSIDKEDDNNLQSTSEKTSQGQIQEESESQIKNSKNVYHQDKLENVFREARSAWLGQTNESAHVNTSQESATNGPSSGGAFSFGFDLGEEQVSKEQNDSGFSFSFDVPTQVIPNANDNVKEEEPTKATTDDKDMDTLEAEPLAEERRRIGLRFPTSDLELYQADFFSQNDGQYIMDDLEGFKTDDNIKEQWNKERQTLTLDWKRKRKYAMSRIQKRMKLR